MCVCLFGIVSKERSTFGISNIMCICTHVYVCIEFSDLAGFVGLLFVDFKIFSLFRVASREVVQLEIIVCYQITTGSLTA